MSFSNLGLGPKLLRAVTDAGYSEPTPIQSAAIPLLLAGHDLIGIAQTGTGKTAAFVLPLLERLMLDRPTHGRPTALILAPTRELAIQIDEHLAMLARQVRVRRVTIYGGVGEGPQIQKLRAGVDVIVATPGRLIDLMGSRHVNLSSIRYVVLDEADRMLDMGFLPQIRRVVNALPQQRQTLLFSATLSREIEQITRDFQHDPQIVQIGRRSDPAETVKQVLHPVSKAQKVDLLLHLLNDQKLDSVLVFSRTKHGADKIARKLAAAKVGCAAIHSNRSQGQRVKALEMFREGKVRVLVATDIAARGIDVEGISHVINFDFPMHPEDYVHRIGRTGRAHAKGDAISFVSVEDGPYVHDLEKMIGRKIERRVIEGFSEASTLRSYSRAASSSAAPAAPRPMRGRGPQQRRARVW